jgi:hypothetical protein
MLDLAIVVALVVLNAVAHSAYIRWRNTPKGRGARGGTKRRGAVYPTHPSPGLADLSEQAVAVRPIGIDW